MKRGRFHAMFKAGEMVVLLLLVGCGGGLDSSGDILPTDARPGTQDASAPIIDQLHSALNAEFERLGIDPDKVAAAAPSGSDNAVFDLSAVVLDPDGPPDGEGGGELPPTGIELRWTERSIGDYDQNGEVNISDLQPMGQYWQQLVNYDDPALHGGFDTWPAGDPDGLGAGNWRIARVDGDGNGELNISDITPIAQHWNERVSGYRVYRKGPGEASFAQVAVVERPAPGDEGLRRYSFSGHPPSTGTYEYYVIPYANNEGQGSAKSNIASATLDAGFADTTPPTWDNTVGVASVVDNTDNTVTVEWSVATDTAVPPAPNSPPVTYNVYYSTISPMDFATAAKVPGATSPWISSELIADQTYYFSVRAQDSANPPNEEANTTELSVLVSGEVIEDFDPPVWTEPIAREGYEGYMIDGMREVEVLDGRLRITHAEAFDELSPPVHYDLYYISDHVADGVLYTEGENEGQLRADVQIIEDIPPVFDLIWQNREGVSLLVRARDSAEPPNYADSDFRGLRAPISVDRQLLDKNFPGINLDTLTDIDYATANDPFNHKFYFCYLAQHNDQMPEEVWFIEVDADTATWSSTLLHSVQPGEILSDRVYLARSWTGDIWVRWISGYDWGTLNFDVLRTSGEWERWEAEDPSQLINLDTFDHNGNPLLLDIAPSGVQENRFKLNYTWWDSASHEWITEIAHDPAGIDCSTFVRPDGILQLLVNREALPFGDNTSTPKTYMLERSTDGVWTLVREGVGTSGSDERHPTWGYEVAWSGGTRINGPHERFYYNQSGYHFLPDVIYRDSLLIAGKMWPAEDGAFHGLPSYVYANGEYFKQTFAPRNYSAAIYKSKAQGEMNGFQYNYMFDPITGYFAYITAEPDMQTREYEFVLRTVPSGESLFEP